MLFFGRVLLALLLWTGLSVAAPAQASVEPGTPPLDAGQAWYPRVIRLQHADTTHNGRVLATTNTGAGGTIHESTDDGRTFRRISEIPTGPAAGEFSCCSALFEFPRRLGSSPAGTLIWAASINTLGGGEDQPNPTARIVAWTSADHGYTWAPIGGPIVTGSTGHGLWEPEFSEAAGQLVMHFSDKTQQPRYGQTLARVRSADGGLTWSAKVNTVAGEADAADSPGMPVVRRLPNGGYVMVYEYCELRPVTNGHGCRVYLRTSSDGWNWGDPANPGTIIRTADGKHLAHAPTVAWAPGGGPGGRLMVIAKLVRTGGDRGAATVLPESGRTILVNTAGGVGAWYEIDAPVKVGVDLDPPNANLYLPCQNYSPPLLPSADGTRVLEIATDVADGTCKAYVATGSSLGTGDATGVSASAVYRAINLASRRCLDADAGAVTNGTRIQQWTCGGALAQEWRPTRRATGVFSFVNPKSGKCLDVPNGNISVDPGDKAHLWTCNGTGAQDWLPVAAGRSVYVIKPRNNQALCLDVADGSTADGAEARVNPCTNAGSQLWHLDARPVAGRDPGLQR
ncbi:Ricin-type beta-trefoil lectin domain-containing protein [Nonomuraea solani]|uniref:Ricin-type beta-trefoil lectin domain-containing protein n=2 Tax=Nonomuraea solani TaxID=1144553 RepID=A0A1H6EUS1_9ACTN|nr:Ricin-type beta-trefoil lectin domain-containing protein [Nonomuraea solani]